MNACREVQFSSSSPVVCRNQMLVLFQSTPSGCCAHRAATNVAATECSSFLPFGEEADNNNRNIVGGPQVDSKFCETSSLKQTREV